MIKQCLACAKCIQYPLLTYEVCPCSCFAGSCDLVRPCNYGFSCSAVGTGSSCRCTGQRRLCPKNVVNQSGLGSNDDVWLEGYLFCASNLGQGFFILDSFSCLLYKPPSNKVVPFPLPSSSIEISLIRGLRQDHKICLLSWEMKSEALPTNTRIRCSIRMIFFFLILMSELSKSAHKQVRGPAKSKI